MVYLLDGLKREKKGRGKGQKSFAAAAALSRNKPDAVRLLDA